MRLLTRIVATLVVAMLFAALTSLAVSPAATAVKGKPSASTAHKQSAAKAAHKKAAHKKRAGKEQAKKNRKGKQAQTSRRQPRRGHSQDAHTETQSSQAQDNRSGGFAAPTSRTYLKATCVVADENVYDVTFHWQVTGGRYANMGKGPNYTYGDYVYNGEARVVTTQMRFYDWPGWGEAMQETTDPVSVPFQQMIAPIDSEDDRSTWVNVYERVSLNISCA